MTEPRERRIRTRTIAFQAVEWGRGPLILMFHGITANGRMFDAVAEQLADRFHVVSVDERGHGRSDKPAGDSYTARHYADDVAALVDAIGEGLAIVVGHSLGARNGIVAGVTHPDAVAGVVAIDFVPFIETEVLDALESRVNAGARPFASLAEVRSYLKGRYPVLPADAVERRARYGYVERAEGFVALADPAAMAATCRSFRVDFDAEFRAVRVPVILVRGAVSKLVTASAFAKARAARPDMPAVEVEGADHYVPEVKPAETAAVITEFAARNVLLREGKSQ